MPVTEWKSGDKALIIKGAHRGQRCVIREMLGPRTAWVMVNAVGDDRFPYNAEVRTSSLEPL